MKALKFKCPMQKLPACEERHQTCSELGVHGMEVGFLGVRGKGVQVLQARMPVG